MNYHDKKFRPLTSSENSETIEDTVFHYEQSGNVLTSKYSGGNVIKGHLIGVVEAEGTINMRYHQVNAKGELITGI